MANKKCLQNAENFVCENCNFACSKISNFKAHLSTRKHTRLINANQTSQKNAIAYSCICGKEYKHLSSLCKHKNLCKLLHKNEKQIIYELIQQNDEFKQLMIEQSKQLLDHNKQLIEMQKFNSITQINTNCNNTTNKFNLNVFLNEQCKDALNLAEFVNSLQLQLSDLQNVGKFGYSEGISKIFVNGLKELDLYKRPLHCSDIKRETLYVKDEDKWQKEDDENTKLKYAIQQITHKNIKQIPKWVEEHPSCKNSESDQNEEYMKLVSNSMTGNSKEEQLHNMNKIISKLAKEVTIDKEHL